MSTTPTASGNYGKSSTSVERRPRQRRPDRQKAGPTPPTDLEKLRLNALHARQAWGRAKLDGSGGFKRLLSLIQWLVAKVNTLRPVRTMQLYGLRHGPLMSAGIGFNMFFSILGLLATGFSIAGLVLAGQPELVNKTVQLVAQSAPGLLKVNGQQGIADPHALLNPSGLGLTAIIGALVTIFTSLGWISSLRDGLRGVLAERPLQLNAVLQRLHDAGTLLLLGVALVLTSGVSILFTGAIGFIADLLHIDRAIVAPISWLIGIIVPLLLNWVTAVIMFRLAAGLRLSHRAWLEATIIAGAGTTVLQLFSSQLLARAGANPLLASFAIIIGLLIWFNLVSQVYLVSGSWAAIREADTGAVAARRPGMLGSSRPAFHPGPQLAHVEAELRARDHRQPVNEGSHGPLTHDGAGSLGLPSIPASVAPPEPVSAPNAAALVPDHPQKRGMGGWLKALRGRGRG
ncbi:YihY/virulence factor BrkB family protein [Sinomonas terrae]|uniref:YihY/virulence factor BrkB family protein n=1 Tax=Sinomonas terrae TaxID=2908838 RepID=A0ABS9U3I5_9MICC|nr:YihY/virulence factor BrkB family protein [Sinomonas terrae]MCH6471258.1 YihY/virulence factor BrkB family protein [Sinomonas terrae]